MQSRASRSTATPSADRRPAPSAARRARASGPVLDPGRLRAWRLRRQLITAPHATTPEAVARQLIGIQAQVVSAAALAASVRGEGLGIDSLTTALAERRLVRAWAMRGTLHAFDADDYPVIVASLRRRETWRRPTWFRYFEVTEAEMESIIEGVGSVLDDGRPRTRKELAADLGKRLGRGLERQLSSSWGTLLKPAADRGYLIHAAGEGSTVTFTRPDRWIDRWREVDPDEALPAVLRRYLATYGPASTDEVRRWWGGLKSSFIRAALGELGRSVVNVEVDSATGLLLAEDVQAIAATTPLRGAVHLLGPFDPLIVGAGTRDALIPPARYKRVSRTAGWISPVVLVNGLVAGVWTSSSSTGSLQVTVDLFESADPATKRALGRAVERLGSIHGLSAQLTFGPVFGGG
jgi:DNA glycosylase AlkZ-like